MNEDDGRALVLFDGDCGFCQRSQRLIRRLDKRGNLRTAPLGGPQAMAAGVDEMPTATGGTMIVVDQGERLERSDAAIRIARHLGGPWRLAAWLGGIVPRPLRDGVYRLIARYRHRLGGGSDGCKVTYGPKSDAS
ncbi:MAG: DUF393 domain-containing protein [Planctomycetota bacterium]